VTAAAVPTKQKSSADNMKTCWKIWRRQRSRQRRPSETTVLCWSAVSTWSRAKGRFTSFLQSRPSARFEMCAWYATNGQASQKGKYCSRLKLGCRSSLIVST
jgi:hypothetical protein